jgi:dynein heavy chain
VCITQLRDFIDMYETVPYRTLHFLIYDINYGGRVTDDIDRRTICTILDDFMNEKVLSDDYQFEIPSGKYVSLPTGTREHYLKQISQMEINPEPEVFGLHENADITSAQEDTNVLFSTILALLPRSTAAGGKSRDQIVTESCLSILEKTPQPWELESVQKRYPTMYSESMNTVIVQEAIRYSKLLRTMRSTLEDAIKALKGEMVMTEALEGMCNSLFTNQVPELWVAVAYPSLMPLAAWVSDLLNRCAFVDGWIERGIPVCFWISGFFFQQAFLTGTLQNYARKYKKPIDAIQFGFHVLDRKVEAIMERPVDGIYIHGLFLEGARWDSQSQSLADSKPKELFTQFPVMWLLPEEDKKEASIGFYKAPVYKILTRRGVLSTTGHSTNFIIHVEIPTKDHPSKWIKAGVALFCSLRY